MDVTFGTAPLAALCNSKQRLAHRWGPDIGQTVGRRLLDLAASTLATLDRIPDAAVSVNATDEITIKFRESIVIRGIINRAPADTGGSRVNEDSMVIISLDVQGSER